MSSRSEKSIRVPADIFVEIRHYSARLGITAKDFVEEALREKIEKSKKQVFEKAWERLPEENLNKKLSGSQEENNKG